MPAPAVTDHARINDAPASGQLVSALFGCWLNDRLGKKI
jgi:hypothetical protein